MKKLLAFVAVSLAVCCAAAEVAGWGNVASRWKNIFPGIVVVKDKIPMPQADNKIFVISNIGDAGFRFDATQIASWHKYLSSGGILVMDIGAPTLFAGKNIFDLAPGGGILGRTRYVYAGFAGKPTALAEKLFGKEQMQSFDVYQKKVAAPSLGGEGRMRALIDDGKGNVRLGVNRVGQGAFVYSSAPPTEGANAELLKKIFALIADRAAFGAAFPPPSAAELAGNGLFTINGRRVHGFLKGDPLTVRMMAKRLKDITGISDFAEKRDPAIQQIAVYPVNFRSLSPDEKTRAADIKYPYGYAFDFDGKTFRILANNVKGLNYGAVDFLRRYCTYRIFGGFSQGMALHGVPYELPAKVNAVHAPSIPSLTVAWGGDDQFDRNVRTTIFSTHSMFQILPPEKFADSHPEYYPWVNGARRLPSKNPRDLNYHGIWQPCLMNKDLIPLTMEYAERYFKKNPDNLSLPLGVNDGGGSCHCAGCEDLQKKYGNQYIPFYNAVAREAAKRYPDKFVSFIAYGEAAAVPKNIRMEPNLLVEVANGMAGDCARLQAWRKAGAKNFGVYEYYNTIGGGYIVPQYFPHTIGELWKKAHRDFAIASVWMELYPATWIFAAPRQYVLNMLAWDISAPIDPLLDEYFLLVYGAANREVRQIFDIFEKRNRRQYNHLDQIMPYQSGDAEQIAKLLQKAAKAKLEPQAAENLRKLTTFFAFLKPVISAGGALNALQKSTSEKDVLRHASAAVAACGEWEKYVMPKEDAAKIFVNRSGQPHPQGFAAMKNQSALQLAPYVEQKIDEKFNTLNCDWQKLRSATTDYRMRAMLGTQLCRKHDHAAVNLIDNPSFEIDAPGKQKTAKNTPADHVLFAAKNWRYWAFPNSKSVLFRDTAEKVSGKYSGAIGRNQIGACLITGFSVNPDCRYRVSFQVKFSPRAKVSGETQVRFLGAKGFIDDGSPVRKSYPEAANGAWANVTMTFSPLAGASEGMLQLSAPVQQEGETVWFDDVKVEKIFDPACFGDQTTLQADWKKGIFIAAPDAAKYPQTAHAATWMAGKCRLYMGGNAQNEKNTGIRITFAPDKNSPAGAFRVKADKTGVVISGDDEGMRCGLYDLFERWGMRWFDPAGRIVFCKVPIRQKIDELDYNKTPRFSYRGMHICGGKMHHDPAVAQWMSFHKMNRRLCSFGEVRKMGKTLSKLGLKADTTVHSFSELIPDKKYFAAHPEFFALVGGKRITQGAGGQLCLSNKDMRREMVKNIQTISRELPEITELGICPNDGYGHCECDACRAMDSDTDRQNGLVNKRIADFVAEVCRESAKQVPGVRLGIYSYSNFSAFHKNMPELPDNLKVSMTQFRCLRHAIDDAACPVNVKHMARLGELTAKSKNVTLYEYFSYEWEILPAPFAPVFIRDMAAYKARNVAGLLSEIPVANHPSWSNFHYPTLVVMKELYEKTASPDDFLRDYCAKSFPGAGDAFFAYFKAWENRLAATPGCLRISQDTEDDVKRFLDPAFMAEAENLLRKAEAKIWPPYRKQTEKVRTQFELWKRLVTERGKYQFPAVIKPLPWSDFAADITPADKALTFVDKITLLPTEEKTAMWIYDSPEKIGVIVRAAETLNEPLKKKVAKLRQDLNDIYYNDNIELFFAASPGAPVLWHFIVSAGGKYVASECEGKRWSWSWQHHMRAQTKFTADGWEMKIEIPKSDFKLPAGASWAFTAVRNRYAPHWVTSGLPKGGVFFNPEKYITVKNGGKKL